jgi:hypothetical protein
VIAAGKTSMAPIDQPPPIVCSIIQQDVGNRLQIRGRVIGRQGAHGNFSLQIVKTGPSGSSNLSQSGTFSIPENREKLLGLATFNMTPKDHFTANLTIHLNGQIFTCKSTDKKAQ